MSDKELLQKLKDRMLVTADQLWIQIGDLQTIIEGLDESIEPTPTGYPADFYSTPLNASITQWFNDVHRGVDFGVEVGTELYAPANCIVWRTNVCQKCTEEQPNTLLGSAVFNDPEWGYGWGTYVILKIEGDNLPADFRRSYPNVAQVYVIYAHLRDFVVNKGQTLTAGQLLGYTGNTGNSTGPHLHLEVRWNEWRKTNVISPELLYKLR